MHYLVPDPGYPTRETDMQTKDKEDRNIIGDVIRLATEDTNVIILDGPMANSQYDEIYNSLEFENYDDGNMGPMCHLCNGEILPEGEFLIVNEVRY